ncbi:MAG: DUF4390 domain-containing protein [Xanthomonadaceae bacterium]|nr:DUF4390 domain-containing protein [Xanthomonadaceae bacterium]
MSTLADNGRSRSRLFGALVALCLAATPAVAQEEEPGFIIRTAFADLVNDVHYLYADIDYGLGESAIEALENGVPLTFEVEVRVIRLRRWMWNQTVAEINQQYQLIYHPLADRYIVRDLARGTQSSYLTFRAAATDLGRISDLEIIADDQLTSDSTYQVRMRVRLVVEAFPAPMRWVAILFPRWRLASDWYAWVLRS